MHLKIKFTRVGKPYPDWVDTLEISKSDSKGITNKGILNFVEQNVLKNRFGKTNEYLAKLLVDNIAGLVIECWEYPDDSNTLKLVQILTPEINPHKFRLGVTEFLPI